VKNYDPRVLIRTFDTLEEERQKFNQVSSDTLRDAEHTQKCSQERVNQALRSSAIALNQAKDDLDDVELANGEVQNLLSQSGSAVETAHETLEIVNNARQQAEYTLATWESQLQKALAWQARAEAQLRRAIQQYEQAQRNLASAQRNLESAADRLRSCINDPERKKNCNSEQEAYNKAQAKVVVAIEILEEAQREVHAAQQELERAQARVRCCQQAVSYALTAVGHANTATQQANQALNEAERSLESAESAHRAITQANSKAIQEHELAEAATSEIHQAESKVTQSQVSCNTARSQADSAYNLAVRGNQELNYRKAQLIRLNRASGSFSGAVQKGIAAVQIATGLLGGSIATGSMSAPVPDVRGFGLQSGEDLVNEAGVRSSLVTEEDCKRRQQEIDTDSIAENQPKFSGPPDS